MDTIAGAEYARQATVEPVLAPLYFVPSGTAAAQWRGVQCAMQRSISIWLIPPDLVWLISKVAPLPNAPRAGRWLI